MSGLGRALAGGASSKVRRVKARRRTELSAAVAAENWTDRDGKARPTAQRRRRGVFVLRDGDDAGVAIAVDMGATMLDQLLIATLITDVQCHAGHDLAALLERTRLGSTMKSCLDFTPVGYEGEREPTYGELRDVAERAQLQRACGLAIWALLRSVCQEQRGPGEMHNLRKLRAGRDVAVRFWSLA